MDYTPRRVSYVFLCMVPVLAIIVAAVRALRVPGIYQAIGGVLFAAIVVAVWILGARAIRAGAAYLIWMSFVLGAYVVKVREGQAPPAIVSLNDVLDILLSVACLLTYLATAAFAASFGRIRWLGRGATRAYVATNLIAFLCLVMRGMSFPDPAALSTPWYTQPGFVAGIPAVPFIMPFLLGVVLLRRAGDKQP